MGAQSASALAERGLCEFLEGGGAAGARTPRRSWGKSRHPKPA